VILERLKGFFDESGKGDPVGFVMAGFIARADEWADFNDEWRAVLDMPPRLEYFHMADAVGARDFGRIRNLASIIRRHKMPGIVVAIPTAEYNAIFKGRVGRRIDQPYFFAALSIMESTFEWAMQNGIDEPIDFIFDEQKDESDYLQSIWTPLVESQPPEISRLMGNRPIHVDDKKNPPLQAADMLAWPFRRILDRAVKNVPHDEFLGNMLADIKIYHQLWTRERLVEFMKSARARKDQEGRYFVYEHQIAEQNKDLIYHAFNQAMLKNARPNDVVSLLSIPAKGMERFLLVHKCPNADTPHLHRRRGDECLAAE